MTVFRNIAFIGGIHGVGKSTICRDICRDTDIEYLSASELLKWKEINADYQNKKVKNIPDTQNRLISGLEKTIQKNKKYLLDGHYSLLDSNNNIVPVPLETFKKINPSHLIIILGKISEIKKRLEERDKRPYDYSLLQTLQNEELSYANYLSKKLEIGLLIGGSNDYSEIINALRDI